jgi:hypothetical protein
MRSKMTSCLHTQFDSIIGLCSFLELFVLPYSPSLSLAVCISFFILGRSDQTLIITSKSYNVKSVGFKSPFLRVTLRQLPARQTALHGMTIFTCFRIFCYVTKIVFFDPLFSFGFFLSFLHSVSFGWRQKETFRFLPIFILMSEDCSVERPGYSPTIMSRCKKSYNAKNALVRL